MDDTDASTPPPTHERSRPVTLPAWLYTSLYGVLLVSCLTILFLAPDLRGEAFIGLIVTLALAPLAMRGAAAAADDPAHLAGEMRRLRTAITEMTNEAGLSEAAKRVIHRRQERDLLRRAIEQDITDQDWDAAMILVKELAERFGYRVDAEEFRARIERARAETLDRSVGEAITRLDELIRAQRWTDAYAEAARIGRLFPESPRVEGLRQRVDEARHRFKLHLERNFLQAAQREDTDRAMELLKELDHYLTEEEVEQFREVARGVIGKARDNLGVRFKLLVQDRMWTEALEVGEQIVRDFPNSRMSQEVREMMDVLRERAAVNRGAAQPG